MSIHDPNHPIWSLLSQLLITITIFMCCTFLYSTGFVTKDIVLMVCTSLASLLADYVRKKGTINFTNEQEEKS